MADVNKVIEILRTQISNLSFENAVLGAEIDELRRRLEEAEDVSEEED